MMRTKKLKNCANIDFELVIPLPDLMEVKTAKRMKSLLRGLSLIQIEIGQSTTNSHPWYSCAVIIFRSCEPTSRYIQPGLSSRKTIIQRSTDEFKRTADVATELNTNMGKRELSTTILTSLFIGIKREIVHPKEISVEQLDDEDEEAEEFVPNIDFELVIPLPDLMEVKTGEEDEKVSFVGSCRLH
uniref:RanBD1 domain-containing protein n=1 Tax=Ditylenchus dipsaci TaxID=166011 RepID=A0A915CUD3_9BILA